MKTLYSVSLIISSFIFLKSFSIYSQTPDMELDKGLWTTGGKVYSTHREGNTIYLGGSFSWVAPNTAGNALLNSTDGKLDDSPGKFPDINGKIMAAQPDGTGGWFIAGDFTHIQGTPRLGLAHLLSDNSLDKTWKADLDIQPTGISLYIYEDRLFVFGSNFTKIGGKDRRGFAELNVNTAEIKDTDPFAGQTRDFGGILGVAVKNDTLFIGGGFNYIQNQSRQNLAALSLSTGKVLPWQFSFYNYPVLNVVIHEGKLYIGTKNELTEINITTLEYFKFIQDNGSSTRKYDIRSVISRNNKLFVAGGATDPWNSYPLGFLQEITLTPEYKFREVVFDGKAVTSVSLADGQIYVAGDFTKINYDPYTPSKGSPVTRWLIALNEQSLSFNPNFKPELPNYLTFLQASDKKVLISGNFPSLYRVPRTNVAAFDAMTGTLLDWNPEVGTTGSIVSDIKANGGEIYLAGLFGTINGKARSYLGSVTKEGEVTGWNPSPNAFVRRLEVTNDRLYAAGSFTNISGKEREGLASFNLSSGDLTNWYPFTQPASAISYNVRAIEVHNGLVFTGINYADASHQVYSKLMVFDEITAISENGWQAFPYGMTDIGALKVYGGKLFIGGSFLLSYDLRTKKQLTWNNSFGKNSGTSLINDLAVINDIVYVGGWFTCISNNSYTYNLAAFHSKTGQLTEWKKNPIISKDFMTNLYGEIYSVKDFNNNLYVGGDFQYIENQIHPNFAAFGKRQSASVSQNRINGTIFNDKNQNCNKDEGEEGVANIILKAEPGTYYGLTDEQGNYSIVVDTGTFTIQQILPQDKGYLKEVICNSNHTVTFTSFDNTISGKDFANQITLVPHLRANVSSNRRRRCFSNQTVVSYCNEGYASANNVKLYLQMPQYVVLTKADKAFTKDNNGNYVFEIGHLEAGECAKINIKDSVICGNESIRGLTQCTKVWITPSNPKTVPADWDGSDIQLKANCMDNGFVRMGIINTGKSMKDSATYRIFINTKLSFTRNYKLQRGDSLMLRIPANGQTIRLEADFTINNPNKKQANITIEACGNTNGFVSKGFVMQLPADDKEDEIDIQCMTILDSYDPNDKSVFPQGILAQQYVPTDTKFEYLIRLQNMGSDTAYTVIVIDTLSEEFDISTFNTAGSSHPYQMSLSGKGHPVVKWIFENINLPSNTQNSLASNGFVKFTIKPKADIPQNTAVKNFADIFFDFNAPIRTNLVSNTLNDNPPISILPENNIVIEQNTPLKALIVVEKDTIICKGTTTLLKTTANVLYQYQWYKNNTLLPSQKSPELTVSESGDYSVKIQDERSLTAKSVPQRIEVLDIPQLELGEDINICSSQAIVLDAGNAGKGFTYLWSDGSTSQKLNVSVSGEYKVTVSNKICSVSDVIKVVINRNEDMFIPNLITPGNDDKNETFDILNHTTLQKYPGKISLTIQDRWGKVVLQTDNYENNWSAEGIPSGIYFYQVSHEDNCFSQKRGWLQIIK